MAKKSALEKAENMLGKVDKRYSLKSDDLFEIRNGSEDCFHMITNSFRYGYMQGMKAAKAEMKRGI